MMGGLLGPRGDLLAVGGAVCLFALVHARKVAARKKLKHSLRPGTSPQVVEDHQHPRVLLDLFLTFEHFCYRLFSFILGMPEVKLRNLGPDGCDALLKVSPYMCRRDEDGLYLPCGAILAFFDEMSAVGQTFSDKEYRVGVSITLDVEVFETIRPGTTLRMSIKSLKQGRTLAFLEMELWDEDKGRLVAVGKHIKYVKMAPAFVFIGWLWRAFSVGLLPAFPDVDKDKKPELACLYDYFPLRDVAQSDQTMTAHFSLQAHHNNFFQTLHGGASAILLEEAALHHRRHLRASSSSSSLSSSLSSSSTPHLDAPPRVRGMKVSYLSALRHDPIVTVTALGRHSCKAELRRASKKGGQGSGSVAVQCILRWQEGGASSTSACGAVQCAASTCQKAERQGPHGDVTGKPKVTQALDTLQEGSRAA